MKKLLPAAVIVLVALATPAPAARKSPVAPAPDPAFVNNDGQLEIAATRLNSKTPQLYVTQMGMLVSPRPEDPALYSFYDATQVFIEEILPLLRARLTQWKSDADHNPSLNRTAYLNFQLQEFLGQHGAIARIEQIEATRVRWTPVDDGSAVDGASFDAGSVRGSGRVGSTLEGRAFPVLEECGPWGSPMTKQLCCVTVCDPSGCSESCNLCNCRTGGSGCCGYGL